MEERVHHLGGVFQIHSNPGAGTRVVVELPLPADGRSPVARVDFVPEERQAPAAVRIPS
jgi:signal transduction histidine kinase